MRIDFKLLIVLLILNHGWYNPVYSQPFTLQTGTFPAQDFEDIEWSDFDNDGDLDYLIFNKTGENQNSNYFIKVFENLGNGNFSEATSIPSVYGGNSLSWFDYDKDGKMDILHVSGNYGGSKGVEIYKNNGNKTFTKISDSFVDEYDGNNVIGDLNNDGYPDIIYNGHSTNKTYIYLNNGNSTFRKLANHPVIGLCYGSFDLGDFDGNGYKDILISGLEFLTGTNYTKVYKNNGNNTFSEVAFKFTGVCNSSGIRGTPSRWGDFDNDADLDVVQVGNEYIYLYKNNGTGSFIKQDSIPVVNVDRGSVSSGDYDNDGDLDIVVSGIRLVSTYTYRASKVYKNNGEGSFTEDTSISLSDQVNGITQWADYDGDGDLDIVLKGLLYRNDQLKNSLYNSASDRYINIYPNPANEFLYINGGQTNYEITICDFGGKVCEVINSTGGQVKIRVAHLSKGVYIVQINDGRNKWTEKLFKN